MGKRGVIATISCGVAVLVSAYLVGPSEVRLNDPENPVPYVTPEPVPLVPWTTVPLYRPERKPETPASSARSIYVIPQNVPKIWGLQAVVKAWQPAKWTVLKYSTSCSPSTICVYIRQAPNGNYDWSATTNFYTDHIEILLNNVVISPREAESSLAHEFGHVLGAPHIVGTANSVMQPVGIYRLLPTKLDLQTVDALGRWELEKMVESSGKTVDARALPK